jgi:hypothetical protein
VVVPDADVAHRVVVTLAERAQDVVAGQKVRQRKRYRADSHHENACQQKYVFWLVGQNFAAI